MLAHHICKPNLIRAGFQLAEKAGLVWNYAGKAFNKLLFLPPFFYYSKKIKNILGSRQPCGHYHQQSALQGLNIVVLEYT
jgi:hypothetical protein